MEATSFPFPWTSSAADIGRVLKVRRRIPSGEPQRYRFTLPTVNHVFLPGHRIMVQIQSSWFPLYDRNPQNYVPNIFFAKPADYVKATQSVFRSGDRASAVWIPVIAK
jgi:predicted acyl esterase